MARNDCCRRDCHRRNSRFSRLLPVDTRTAPCEEATSFRKNTVHMKSSVFIRVPGGSTGFAEDKDEARRIRIGNLLPALSKDSSVILDFREIKYATQSFVHALLGEVLKRHGENVLSQIDFKNCTPQLKSLIQLVVDYSL